jgi:hypothetical protein
MVSGSEINLFQSAGSTYAPTPSRGSMSGTPMVTISFFSRTFMRLNGIL